MRRSLLAALLLLLPVAASALEASVRLSELLHTIWRSDDGAPANIVALTQTPDGYLWLGTGGGLFRFDGVRFERVSALADSPLPSTSITALHTTPDGMLVIGYRFGGLSLFRDDTIRHFGTADGLPGGNAWAFAQSGDGTLLAAFTGGVARWRGAGWQVLPLDGEMLPFRTLVRDGGGRVWVTAKTGAFVLSPGADSFTRAEADLPLFPFLSVAPDGQVWAADFQRGRLVALEPGGGVRGSSASGRPLALPPTADLHWFDSGGALWLRSGDGLVRIPDAARGGSARRPETLTVAQGLNGELASFLEDREGNVWLGTAGGLHRFTDASVRRIDLGGSTGNVGVAPAGGGAVWATTESGGLFHVGETVRAYPQVAEHASHLHRDRDGVVWIGSRNALWRIDGDRRPMEIARPDAADDRRAAVFAPIHAIAKDPGGMLWMHLVVKGTFRRVGEAWHRVPDGPGDRIMSMGNDGEGRLWIGYVDRGARRMDGDRAMDFGPANGLDIGAVYAIHGRGPRVWLGGQRGLALFDGRTMKTLAWRGLGETGVITGIVETASGELWLNAANGLIRIDAAEWQQALRDPGHSVQTQRLDALDGLLGSASQIRPLPSLVEADDGRLWAALPSGLFVVDPMRLRRNRLPPAVLVRSLSVDGRTVSPGQAEAMAVGRADLRIGYTATSLTVPQRVEFRYKLEGYDTDWRDAGGRREAVYTRVGPGEYVFRVIASNNDGIWNEVGAAVPVVIRPAFWQTVWFGLLVLAAFGGLLALLYRWRVWQISQQLQRRLESRLQERERIARELHDTLLQSVTGLTLHVRAAANQVPAGTALRERLEIALRRAHDAATEARDRVTELRLHQVSPVPIEQALRDIGRRWADTGSAGPAFSVEVTGMARDLNPLVAEEALQIAQEAIGNAWRHADARAVTVTLAYGRDGLRLTVRDDGHGFDGGAGRLADRPGHFGLAGMRERAERIGGRLHIRSGDRGTEITLQVPARMSFDTAGASLGDSPGGRIPS